MDNCTFSSMIDMTRLLSVREIYREFLLDGVSTPLWPLHYPVLLPKCVLWHHCTLRPQLQGRTTDIALPKKSAQPILHQAQASDSASLVTCRRPLQTAPCPQHHVMHIST